MRICLINSNDPKTFPYGPTGKGSSFRPMFQERVPLTGVSEIIYGPLQKSSIIYPADIIRKGT